MSSANKLRNSQALQELAAGKSDGKLSPAWVAALDRDSMLSEARVLVEVRLSSGELSRFAVDSITLSDDSGDVHYAANLLQEPSISEGITIGSSSAAARSFQFSVSRDCFDTASIIGRGSFIAGVGEISVAIDGMAFSDRIVLMRGLMTGGLSFGDAGESISFTLKDPRSLTNFDYPREMVDKTTHPDAPASSSGKRYPAVYNQWAAVPCVRINSAPVMISVDASMMVSTVLLNGSVSASEGFSITVTGRVNLTVPTGAIQIGDEIIKYGNVWVDPFGLNMIFFDLKRGFAGTTRAAHTTGTSVTVGDTVQASEWIVSGNDDLEVYTDNNAIEINNPVFPEQVWMYIVRAGLRDQEGNFINSAVDPVTTTVDADGIGSTYTKLSFDTPTVWTDIKFLRSEVDDDAETEKSTPWSDDAQVFAEVVSSRRLTVAKVVEDILSVGSPLGREYIDVGAMSTIDSTMNPIYPSVIADGGDQQSSTGSTEFIESTILSQFPMLSPFYGGGKYSMCLVDYRKDPVGEFIEGVYPCIERESQIVESPMDEAYTSYTMKYKYDHWDGSFKSVVRLDETNNALCDKTSSEIGSISHDVIECISIEREEDALYLLDWMAAHYARPSYSATYCFSPWALVNMNVGDTIRITDQDAGFQSCRAVVEAITYQQGKCSVELVVYPPITGIID